MRWLASGVGCRLFTSMAKPGFLPQFLAGIFAFAALTCGALSPDVLAFSRKGPEAAQSQTALADHQIWVMRSDGAQSCSTKSGQSLEGGAADLKNAKVRVLDSHKGGDGKLHAQMCGAPTGSMNAYLIPKDDLPQAVALGYIQAK